MSLSGFRVSFLGAREAHEMELRDYTDSFSETSSPAFGDLLGTKFALLRQGKVVM